MLCCQSLIPLPAVITRFAPSPTGSLHLGHAYAAIVAHDLARSRNGLFLLRFEDIDTTRVREEFYAAIENDLTWLGLTWDGPPLRQNTPARTAAYSQALTQLIERQIAYPCFCTRRAIEIEIAGLAQAPHGPEGPLYPGTCRQLTPSQRATLLDAQAPHCWRLDAATAAQHVGPLTINDLLHGQQHVDPSLLGDVILARKDIATSYHLAVVIDDAAQQITHVTRGDDLLPSTHVHRLLQALLGLPTPTYLHHPLVCDDLGRRLAKRHDSLSIASLRSSPDFTQQSLRKLLPPLPW
jgi:glutamyl-Q tRNA(Asp) synthetase